MQLCSVSVCAYGLPLTHHTEKKKKKEAAQKKTLVLYI